MYSKNTNFALSYVPLSSARVLWESRPLSLRCDKHVRDLEAQRIYISCCPGSIVLQFHIPHQPAWNRISSSLSKTSSPHFKDSITFKEPLTIEEPPSNMFSFLHPKSFNPKTDIPSLDGKVILVTGANAGLGKQCVLEYSRHQPKQIWLAARNLKKAQTAVGEIKKLVPDAPIKLLELDLSSFESIKKAARAFLSESDRLDILMCNAGIMAVPPGQTKDGYEIQFGTNHLGHALLTKLLLPALEATAKLPGADVRVISVSSFGHTNWPKGGFRFDLLKSSAPDLGSYKCYFQSKLANALWARQLAKEYPQFGVAAIHPGLVQTSLMDRATATPWIVRTLTNLAYPLLPSVSDGARNQLWASVSNEVRGKPGEYWVPVGVLDGASDDAKDDDLAKVLWDWTEKELKDISL